MRRMAQGGGDPSDSRRIDIPKDVVRPASRRKEGVEYMDLETPERANLDPILKVFKEALIKARKN